VRSKGFFICFTGIDGSGKTTHARKLLEYLERHGVSTKYEWNGFEPLLLQVLMNVGRAAFLRGKDMYRDYREYYYARRRLFRSIFISAFFQGTYFLEALLQVTFRVRLPLMLGRNMICDRYVYDTIVGLGANLDYSDMRIRRMLRGFCRFLPKPDLAFLIDLPEEIAYQRKNDTPSLGFLKDRRQIYLNVGKEFGMTVLDGSQDLIELQNLIQDEVDSVLLARR